MLQFCRSTVCIQKHRSAVVKVIYSELILGEFSQTSLSLCNAVWESVLLADLDRLFVSSPGLSGISRHGRNVAKVDEGYSTSLITLRCSRFSGWLLRVRQGVLGPSLRRLQEVLAGPCLV